MGVLVPGGGLQRCDVDFLLSAKRDAATAQRFLTKALGGENHPDPRVINTDKHAAYPPAIVELKADGVLEEKCTHRPVQYLNNVLEQDHRAIKRRGRASQHFRSFWGAWRTIAGYEAIHMIRKGQAYGSAAGTKVGLQHRFILPRSWLDYTSTSRARCPASQAFQGPRRAPRNRAVEAGERRLVSVKRRQLSIVRSRITQRAPRASDDGLGLRTNSFEPKGKKWHDHF